MVVKNSPVKYLASVVSGPGRVVGAADPLDKGGGLPPVWCPVS